MLSLHQVFVFSCNHFYWMYSCWLFPFPLTYYVLHSWTFVVILVLYYRCPSSFCSPRIWFLLLLQNSLCPWLSYNMTIIYEIIVFFGLIATKFFIIVPSNTSSISPLTSLFLPMSSGLSALQFVSNLCSTFLQGLDRYLQILPELSPCPYLSSIVFYCTSI